LPSREYSSVLSSLYALEAAKGMDFKLERVALTLRNLGDPQRRFRSVHIAGTNGKGSVAAMVHSMFSKGGYRVGLYTSPHLVEFRERIRVGTALVSEQEVVDYACVIHGAATVHGIQLTFFELTTVMAFLHFARANVDLAVIEVGLGGRLDATNVIEPEVSVITSISRDHEEYLGDSLTSIAAEKAGILKPGVPAIVGKLPTDAMQVIAGVARERGVLLRRLGADFGMSGRTALTYAGARTIHDLCIGLKGDHQVENAAVAVATAESLGAVLPLSAEAIREGLRDVCWPGRLEVVGQNPMIVLDGAHNEAGAEALVRELPELVGGRPIYLLFGVMRDKRWRSMVEQIAPLVEGVVVVRVAAERAEETGALAASFACTRRVWEAATPEAGLRQVVRLAGAQGAVVVAGSLFLVGAVYPFLHAASMGFDTSERAAIAQH